MQENDVQSGRGSVSLRSLRKDYGATVAVRDMSLEIRAGEFVTLLGPSGSGKTTTLMMIAGFVLPTSGEIYVDGAPIAFIPPEQRNIGVVFQNYALFPHMTVAANLAFPLEMRRMRRDEIAKRTAQAVSLVRLTGYEHRYPGQLSGGQQQRVALARAIVFDPPVLLMDEPLGALDKKLREHLQLELKHLQRRLGVTVIYVTHDQYEALTMSDRIVVMNNGGVEQVGTPREVYDDPATPFVADFLGESNALRGRLVTCEADGSTVALDDGGLLKCGPTSAQVGTPVVVIVRPEQVNLAVPSPGPDALQGEIGEVIYSGDVIRYWVRIPGYGTVQAKDGNRGGATGHVHSVGETVHISWSRTNLKVFAATDAGPLEVDQPEPGAAERVQNPRKPDADDAGPWTR